MGTVTQLRAEEFDTPEGFDSAAFAEALGQHAEVESLEEAVALLELMRLPGPTLRPVDGLRQLEVRTLGRVIPLEVRRSALVRDVLHRVRQTTGLPAFGLALANGRPLAPHLPVSCVPEGEAVMCVNQDGWLWARAGGLMWLQFPDTGLWVELEQCGKLKVKRPGKTAELILPAGTSADSEISDVPSSAPFTPATHSLPARVGRWLLSNTQEGVSLAQPAWAQGAGPTVVLLHCGRVDHSTYGMIGVPGRPPSG
mmetsp:Transcript_61637/g.142066  ORF Transcript_61637/g.142066 Transcript_61637/m.142066 type:complete len:254 (-) Transcript_61637:11-772(-)